MLRVIEFFQQLFECFDVVLDSVVCYGCFKDNKIVLINYFSCRFIVNILYKFMVMFILFNDGNYLVWNFLVQVKWG